MPAARRINRLSNDEALRRLGTAPPGLSTAEAQRRLHTYGLNRIEKARGESRLVSLLKQFGHFFALILWVAAGLAFFADWSEPGQGMAKLGFAIVVVIVVNGVFSFWQEYRAEQTLAGLWEAPAAAGRRLARREGRRAAAEQLVPGDVMLLEEGDHIPADCRLIEAFGVRVNNATVTGESVPLVREAAPCDTDDLLHSSNILLAGTSMVSGQAKAVVFATGMQTEFGKIAHLTADRRRARSPRCAGDRASQPVDRRALGADRGALLRDRPAPSACRSGTTSSSRSASSSRRCRRACCPTVTLSLVLATQRMARRNVLIRHLPSVETLGSTTVICTDKTGTLTENRMTREAALSWATSNTPSIRRAAVRPWPSPTGPSSSMAGLCQDLREGRAPGSAAFLGDPTEIALVEMAQAVLPAAPPACPPSTRSRSTPTACGCRRCTPPPEGPMLYCKGALETVLPLCSRVLARTASAARSTPELRSTILAAQEAMAEQGLRVLALAYRPLDAQWTRRAPWSRTSCWPGWSGWTIRPGRRSRSAAQVPGGRDPGDHDHRRPSPDRARDRPGDRPGRSRTSPIVITGEQLRRLSEVELQLPARLAGGDLRPRRGRPEDADRRGAEAQGADRGGDRRRGQRRARAEERAYRHRHGHAGTDVAKEAADMVLPDDNFASIVAAVEEGRAVFDNIRKFLTYILTPNVPELIPYLGVLLFRIPLPLTLIQILAIDMGTDMLTALGLGVEQPGSADHATPAAGARRAAVRPRRWLLRAYLFLGVIEAAAAMAAFFFVLHGAGWTYGEAMARTDVRYLQATTACLAAVVVMQIVNVFLCRSTTRSAWSVGLLGNRLILWGVGAGGRPHPGDLLHRVGQCHLRHRAHLGSRVAVRDAVRGRPPGARGATQVARATPRCAAGLITSRSRTGTRRRSCSPAARSTRPWPSAAGS